PATVYLVGAGPGDAGLATTAAVEALKTAACVIYDALANPVLLKHCPPDCENIYVGKQAAAHTLSQDGINQLLVDKARYIGQKSPNGRCIVRLKGGDPYVFGRGGEEGEFLRKAGVPFRTIPGITAGLAGAAYAGIPVTHRELTSTVTFVTGHERDRTELSAAAIGAASAISSDPIAPRVNYKALAQLGGTLVFYMGVKNLPDIAGQLMAGGMAASTPAAVIHKATLPQQRTVVATLGDIAAQAKAAGITAPAITIVGEVVKLRSELNWFEAQPLFGQTILVTRTRQQASGLAAELTALGANVLEAPTIEITPPDDFIATDAALKNLAEFDCVVFTSANGVEAAWRRLRAQGLDCRAFAGRQVAAIGPATHEALGNIGIVADLMPEEFVGEKLAELIIASFGKGYANSLAGRKFLLLRADIARPALREALLRAGAQVTDIAIYKTLRPAGLPAEVLAALEASAIQWITFTSASTADNLYEMLPKHLRAAVQRCRRLSIGPITSQALRSHDWPATIEATQHDIPGMINALLGAVGQA
ncbi:MAG: uroporphyrinogen-III C-methyltransferase, partial [Phycisphaerales bacterium]|nr:uroporphyrinogen-III C-methyltransferase [Phycisphaerales bacterium]